jgi:hypothetical protein
MLSERPKTVILLAKLDPYQHWRERLIANF